MSTVCPFYIRAWSSRPSHHSIPTTKKKERGRKSDTCNRECFSHGNVLRVVFAWELLVQQACLLVHQVTATNFMWKSFKLKGCKWASRHSRGPERWEHAHCSRWLRLVNEFASERWIGQKRKTDVITQQKKILETVLPSLALDAHVQNVGTRTEGM